MAAGCITIRKECPGKRLEIWSQDEARLGLQPIVRRTWSPKGQRYVATQVRKYQWVYVYAFVHPMTGKSFWLILPSVNTELMNMTLDEFSRHIDPQKKKLIVLLMDGAGWHRSEALETPENIRIFPIPPYSPELQPVECGWPMLKESVANGYYDDLDSLEASLSARCEWLSNHPDTLKGAVGFRWIQEIESTID